MKRYSKCFYKIDVDIEFIPQIEGTYYDINLNNNHDSNPVVIVNGKEYNFLNNNKFIIDERAKKYHRFKIFSILTRMFVLIIVIIILIIFLI